MYLYIYIFIVMIKNPGKRRWIDSGTLSFGCAIIYNET